MAVELLLDQVLVRKRLATTGHKPFHGKVAEAGLEPARPIGHRILNPERLPIPPLGHFVDKAKFLKMRSS